jgi:hypothetical protein
MIYKKHSGSFLSILKLSINPLVIFLNTSLLIDLAFTWHLLIQLQQRTHFTGSISLKLLKLIAPIGQCFAQMPQFIQASLVSGTIGGAEVLSL